MQQTDYHFQGNNSASNRPLVIRFVTGQTEKAGLTQVLFKEKITEGFDTGCSKVSPESKPGSTITGQIVMTSAKRHSPFCR